MTFSKQYTFKKRNFLQKRQTATAEARNARKPRRLQWSEPQSLDKNLIKLFGNEFGIAPGSFLLIYEKFSCCSSRICICATYVWNLPHSQISLRRTFLPSIFQRNIPSRRYPYNCPCATCFAQYCVLLSIFGILRVGIASLGQSVVSALRLSAVSCSIRPAFLLSVQDPVSKIFSMT